MSGNPMRRNRPRSRTAVPPSSGSAAVPRARASIRIVPEADSPLDLSEPQQKFRREVAAQFENAEKKSAAACAEPGGWLFFAPEFRFLSLGRFWGRDASRVSRARKAELSDPIPAIVDFQKQLNEKGIGLLVVPVPPKAAVYAEEIVAGFDANKEDPAPFLHRFYEELRAANVRVLDLAPLFLRNRSDSHHGTVYCKSDTHWASLGCTLAAKAIAEEIRDKVSTNDSAKEYVSEWKESQITGDLVGLLPSGAAKPGSEKIFLNQVSEKATGGPVQPDRNSSVLLLGDSHTLVFHDFLAERAGLVDHLAQELGFAPDLIGTRGSGATPVRINLYRHSLKNPEYLGKKKVVIWCFSAREFTEATEGWALIPMGK